MAKGNFGTGPDKIRAGMIGGREKRLRSLLWILESDALPSRARALVRMELERTRMELLTLRIGTRPGNRSKRGR